jgi:hypothetical protein
LAALTRAALASGDLGKHNGLPASIMVTTTLKELEAVPTPRSPAAAPCYRCPM